MKKVYLVELGENFKHWYNDRVFRDRKEAEKYVEKQKMLVFSCPSFGVHVVDKVNNDYRITEWEVD
jgi:hypothetical protein